MSVTAVNSDEPVANGVVMFTISPASNGASATLSAPTAVIGADGTAQLEATANSLGGDYTITATTGGAVASAEFSLTNQVQPVFSGLADQTITFGTTQATFTGRIAADSQVPEGETVSLTLNGVTQTAAIASNGSFSSVFNDTADLGVGGSPYTVSYSYTTDGTFTNASQTTTISVTPALPNVQVGEAGGTYDGSAFAATATVAGLNGTPEATLEGIAPALSYYSGTYAGAAQLSGLIPLSARATEVGSYTVSANFAGSADYNATASLANFVIAPAAPTMQVDDSGGTYRRISIPRHGHDCGR